MKKIVVLLPVLPEDSFAKSIEQSLSFLVSYQYEIDYIDPCAMHNDVNNAHYYRIWRERLSDLIGQYDAFFGFSFGGVILQQCLSLFMSDKKKVFLFSAPTYADDELRQKLKKVIYLARQGTLKTALTLLYQYANYPNNPPAVFTLKNNDEATARLITGLERVVSTDSRLVVSQFDVPLIHFVGSESRLVQKKHIIVPESARLYTVARSGMRVLEDNPAYCQQIILDELS